jgi:hypothetical protein
MSLSVIRTLVPWPKIDVACRPVGLMIASSNNGKSKGAKRWKDFSPAAPGLSPGPISSLGNSFCLKIG